MLRNRKAVHFSLGILTVFVLLVAGCQGAPTAAPVVSTAAPAAPTVAPAAPTEAKPAASGTRLKIGFVHLGPINDQGWDTSFHNGMLEIQKAYPNVDASYVDNVPYGDDIARVLEQMVSDGAKLIVITSGTGDYTPKAAAAHPDVRFVEVSTDCKLDNCTSFYIKHWDPSYLIGIVAGQLTKTNKLGYVGSFPTKDVYASVNAFELGAQSVNPKAVTSAVLLNSWFDPQAEKQAAQALIDGGADVLFNIMNDATILQVAQDRKVWSAMWNADMRSFGPDAYVSAVMLDWNDFLKSEVQKYLDGNPKGYREALLPLGAGTDRDKWGQNVPADVAAKADAVREKMLKENLNVFVGPIKDTKGVIRVPAGEALSDDFLWKQWTWAVEGVTGMPESTP